MADAYKKITLTDDWQWLNTSTTNLEIVIDSGFRFDITKTTGGAAPNEAATVITLNAEDLPYVDTTLTTNTTRIYARKLNKETFESDTIISVREFS